MAKLKASTRVNAATVRVCALPPPERYFWLGFVAVAAAALFTSAGMIGSGAPGMKWWPAVTMSSGCALVAAVVWRDFRRLSAELAVRRSTAMVDEHYEELVTRYWRHGK